MSTMETITVLAEELRLGDVIVMTNDPEDVAIVTECRPDRAWPNRMVLSYHYLGHDYQLRGTWSRNHFFDRITNMEEVI